MGEGYYFDQGIMKILAIVKRKKARYAEISYQLVKQSKLVKITFQG